MGCDELSVDGLVALLGLGGPSPRCVRPRTLHLAHKGEPNTYQVSRVGCDSWGCPGCSNRKRLRFGVHLVIRFLDSERPVAEELVSGKDWKRRHQQLSRSGADYAKVDAGGGNWWVFHNAHDACHPFASVGEAISRLGERLRAVQPVKGQRNSAPVSLSRRWALPQGGGDYSLVGLLPVARPDRLRAALEAAEVRVKDHSPRPGREWSVGYTLGDGRELRVDGTRFEVTGEDLRERSVWRDHSCIRTVPSTRPPVFGIAYGVDGPELVVRPAVAAAGEDSSGWKK